MELSALLRSDVEEQSDYSLAEHSEFNPLLGVSVAEFHESTLDDAVYANEPSILTS
ncbi:hypothetical protein [Bathymodiolus platifrons methanotrophic gill symbiont]|uniref:hypothetical protein n=1 Tax=Bathymodiolus platifrons methanotrophic gill symbiont TaxID=113268 RepID=UPI001C8DA0C3|nr:hypothetical protein [Bathymodiolus platifrons methanotrophic gill symbiont]